jgi:hypothetical protein
MSRPGTPEVRIWAKVIFWGRSGMPHDSAGRSSAQIINPLGRGTLIGNSQSWARRSAICGLLSELSVNY